MMSNIRINICFFVLILVPLESISHDTTHIHPMITKLVSDLIKKEEDIDSLAYKELYSQDQDDSDRGVFWGKDRDLDEDIVKIMDLEYLLDDNLPVYGNDLDKEKGLHYNNVIDGVVQEDAPLGKAIDHFFHATTRKDSRMSDVLCRMSFSVCFYSGLI